MDWIDPLAVGGTYVAMGIYCVYVRSKVGPYPVPNDVGNMVILMLWPVWLLAAIAGRAGMRQRG